VSTYSLKAKSEPAPEAFLKLPESVLKLSPYAQWSRLDARSVVTPLTETILVL
jgi:hypothetical protein